MWIKLIAPRMSLRPMDSELKRMMSPSLALLTLGALTPSEHRVTLADENAKPLTLGDQPDLVGLSVNVDTSCGAYAIADAYRARGIPVVLGGIHVSAMPEEAALHADAIVIGPAEESWPRLLTDLAANCLQTRYVSSWDTAMPPTPAPRWELLDETNYLYTNIVCASRGCPHRCEFCYNSCRYIQWGFRPRPVAEIVAEIEQLNRRHVMFIDDNLLGDLRWTRELIAALRPLGIKWNGAVSTALSRHPALMDAMAESGCQSLFIGFESLNRASLAEAHKHQNSIDRYQPLVEGLHDRGIMINASLVFGFDSDDTTVFPETLNWLIEQRIETMTAHILTPYPGTVFYRRLAAEGRITDHDPRHYNTAHVVFRPKQMSPEELRAGYLDIYRRFYSLPTILRRLPTAPEQRLPYLLFNLGYRKFGRLTATLARGGSMHRIGRLASRLAYGLD